MSPQPSRPSPAERAEMARLLPVPADRDLPPGRHCLLKDYLMTEIQQDTATAVPSRRPWRRLALIAAPLAAGAMAAVLAIGAPFSHSGNDAAASRAAGPSGTKRSSSSAGGGAVQLLDRIATVAASKPAPAVRDDQYVYIKSLVAFLSTDGDAPAGAQSTLEEPHLRQVWLSVDGSRSGLLREKGNISLGTNPGPGLNVPTYRYLASLPTDPDVLLKKIYADTKGHGPRPDEEAFTTIGDALREQIAPPKVSAALYKAAAKIPGVRVIDAAVDAAGRHGIAVAFLRADGERTEWIFDKKTLALLGERSVMAKNTAWAEAGQITGSSAILDRAIVNKPGQIPAPPAI